MRTVGNAEIKQQPGAIGRLARAFLTGCAIAFTVMANAHAQAPEEFTVEKTFFRTTIQNRPVRLEGLIMKRADLTGPLPIALIAHGKSANLADMLASRASDYSGAARDFAQRGYLSVVVMRRGFGQSDGPISVSVTCESKSFGDFLSADADDLQGALDVVSKRPDADPHRVIGVGVSAGGAAIMALAARNPRNLKGVISVSGGLATPGCPKEDALVSAFKDFGATSRVPSIWIYAKNDSLFGPKVVERMQSAYLDGGGDVKLVMLEKFGNDGHALFGDANGRVRWLMEADGFLRFHDLPSTRRDAMGELMKLLKFNESSRGFLDQYLAAPTFKAMALTPDGQFFMMNYGSSSMDGVRGSVLKSCQERYKTTEPCRIVMEGNNWVGAKAAGEAKLVPGS